MSVLLAVSRINIADTRIVLFSASNKIFTAKRRSARCSHEEGPALIVQLRSDAHLRADIRVARFGDYSGKMSVRQVPIMRPETAIARRGGRQGFREVDVGTSVATDRSLYR